MPLHICRKMSKPRRRDWDKLVRLAKYLKGKERYVQSYRYQKSTAKDSNKFVNVWVDTDWAGCPETRRSTSGGIVMLNQHPIKDWSVTQTVVAISSGEAEYYGLVRGASIGLGIVNLLADLGVKRKLKLKTDASVAKAISGRRGTGQIRHLEVSQLWLQDRVNRGDLEVEKVPGETNRADQLTKYKDALAIDRITEWTSGQIRSDRHHQMPVLDAGTQVMVDPEEKEEEDKKGTEEEWGTST